MNNLSYYLNQMVILLDKIVDKIADKIADIIEKPILQWSTHNMPYIINNNIILFIFLCGSCCVIMSALLVQLLFISTIYGVELYIFGLLLIIITLLMDKHNNLIRILNFVKDMHKCLKEFNNIFCHKDKDI